jgi:S1-C subfamily serine protease
VAVSYADAVDRAAPSVVSIYTRSVEVRQVIPQRQRIEGNPYVTRSSQNIGSGVIVSEDGLTLTNYHVIRGVNQVRVALWDGRVAAPRLVGTDPATDLAVLKIDLDGLPAAPLADGAGLRVGDVVLAIGNALGLSHTVTMGIVSATGRNDLGGALYEDFIQTDAAINAGNSGGALINTRGEVIGISTRKSAQADAQNIGFAIPVALARDVMEQILEYGSVRRGWLGALFGGQPLTAVGDGTATVRGVQVMDVIRGAPAWDAGIRAGDTLLSLDGMELDDPRAFLLQVSQRPPGSQVELEVLRGEEVFMTYATLIQQPPLR